MHTPILGIHHMTAIVNDPQANVDFYTGVLGLRLVKQTVNFDDPFTYHLYYGDDLGRPGTIVTFFPWAGIRHGSRGTGQVSTTSFAIPAYALDYWADRLASQGIRSDEPRERLGERFIALFDPSGLALELVAQPGVEMRPAWHSGSVPVDFAIRGMAGVTLDVAQHDPTATLLSSGMGFRHVATEGNRSRYAVHDGAVETTIDIVHRPHVPFGMLGAGSVHHIAWRVANDADQTYWRDTLTRSGLDVTPVRDRQYFRSIYFREPGGILFEIATDPPGFSIDEAPEHLGERLMLPPWLEPMRAQISERLVPISIPSSAGKE